MEFSAEAVWQECLQIIRDNISRQSFKTWFEPLKADKLVEEDNETRLTVKLPSRFYYEWLEEHYFGLLSKTIMKVLGPQGRLFYNIVIEKDDMETGYQGSSMQLPSRKPSTDSAPPKPQNGNGAHGSWHPSQNQPAPKDTPPPSHYPPQGYGHPVTPPTPQSPFSNPFVIPGLKPSKIDSQLNVTYTFERFIEGDCNRLARSASLAIAQQPGATSFNPFLIYGGVGLGKTHLIQAIGNYVLANNNAQTVLYISSERFTTEFVQAIQNNRVSEFSMFYRQIDLLIVDDVQFFGGKEKNTGRVFSHFQQPAPGRQTNHTVC